MEIMFSVFSRFLLIYVCINIKIYIDLCLYLYFLFFKIGFLRENKVLFKEDR